jgi:hypothetical protein
MPIRIPVILEIADDGLATLRAAVSPLTTPGEQSSEAGSPPSGRGVELPERWKLLEETSGVRYTWGEDQDVYDPFLTYEGRTSKGKAHLAIGKCDRTRTHGRDRIYYIVISIGPEGGMRAVAEFLATDDYEETGDVIAIIKGKEGGGRQFDSADELPPVYRGWNTVTYRNRVDYPGSYMKQGLVCNEQDAETMLNHSLAQIQLRNL